MFNFYHLVKKSPKFLNPNYETHAFQVPFRAIIASGSGSGKSNFCVNLIYTMDKTFHKIILCLRSEKEPLYQFLKDKLENKIEIHENGFVPDMIEDTEETDKNIVKGGFRHSKLIIFDDLMLEGRATQEKIASYFIRARKHGYSCIYISQSFYAIPINIRKNCLYYILGKGLLSRDLKSILSSTAGSSDKNSLSEFESTYKRFTSQPMTVCIIDLEKKIARNKINIKELKEEDIYYFQ